MTDIQRLISENDDLIRARAHQFWEDEGRPDGRHLIHWQRAIETLTLPVAKMAAKAAATKAAPQDVTLIDGIGPKIAKQLAEEGISTLAQIAALTPVALAKLDARLALKGRSARDEWIAQARELLAGAAPRAKVDRAKTTAR